MYKLPHTTTHFFVCYRSVLAEQATTQCGQLNSGVISMANLSKFNIIPKAFIPSILLLQKATKR